ncbi:YwpF-like family protein [Virgibacillus ainsalahensis]
MKTFKLKALEIMEHREDDIIQNNIPLLDGLIINREDEQNQWLIEAYVEHSYKDFFSQLKEENDEIMVQVKITKKSNEPATFITTVLGVNEIGDNLNVLLIGTIVDRHKSKIEQMLSSLIEKGYQGEELLKKFKEAN